MFRKDLIEAIQDLEEVIDDVSRESALGVMLYLDPETPTIRYSVGDMTPIPAHYRRWCGIMTIPPKTVGADIVKTLTSKESINALMRMVGAYRGSEWDGSNECGHWCEDSLYEVESDLMSIIDSEWSEWRTYWDAAEWLIGPDYAQNVADQIREDLRENYDSIMSLAEAYYETGNGLVSGGVNAICNAIIELLEECPEETNERNEVAQ